MANTRSTNWGRICSDQLSRIRARHPLVHHITNFVVMNDTANATLALGATPVMAHAQAEVAEMVGMAGALVLNPGTLTPAWVAAMNIAGQRANKLGIPIVYDPVGVGATKLRTATGRHFLKTLRLAVIRGNSGEIGALAGAGGIVGACGDRRSRVTRRRRTARTSTSNAPKRARSPRRGTRPICRTNQAPSASPPSPCGGSRCSWRSSSRSLAFPLPRQILSRIS